MGAIARLPRLRTMTTLAAAAPCVAAARAQPASAASAPEIDGAAHAVCVDKLAAPSLVSRLPYLEFAATRHAVCRCALETQASAPMGSDPESTAEPRRLADAVGTVLACLGKEVAGDKPQPASATGMSQALAAALPHAAGAQGSYRGPALMAGDLDCLKPDTLPQLQRAGVSGTTVLAYRVSRWGAVDDVIVVKSAGPTRLHKLIDFGFAQRALDCRFAPATRAGKPVDAWATFSLGIGLGER